MNWGTPMINKTENDVLDEFFDAARADAPEPSAEFMLRMQEAALAAQVVRVAPPVRVGIMRQIMTAVGGWPALAGLSATALVGVWIGAMPPDAMADSVSTYLGTSSGLYEGTDSIVDPLSGFDFGFSEG